MYPNTTISEGAVKPGPPITWRGTTVKDREAAAADPRNLRRLIFFIDAMVEAF
jgi:hypothetical protein